MSSNTLKNVLVVVLLSVTVVGLYKFEALLDENTSITREFSRDRDLLLQELEQERAQQNVLSRYLKASRQRLSRLFHEHQQALRSFQIERAEAASVRTALQAENARLSGEKGILQARLTSLRDLKLAIRAVKKDIRQRARVAKESHRQDIDLWGNQGYLIHNGEHAPAAKKIKIEVNPAVLHFAH